jgi:hypothetical protein
MNEYIQQYYVPEAELRSGKVAFRDVWDLPLQTILFTISRMEGSASPHMALQSHFQYAVECMEPCVFNWCDELLRSMKKKLTNKSILVYFFLERVPHLHL